MPLVCMDRVSLSGVTAKRHLFWSMMKTERFVGSSAGLYNSSLSWSTSSLCQPSLPGIEPTSAQLNLMYSRQERGSVCGTEMKSSVITGRSVWEEEACKNE